MNKNGFCTSTCFCCPCCGENPCTSCVSRNAKQIRGLVINNIRLQTRQYFAVAVPLLLPLLCMLYVRFLQFLFNKAVLHLELNKGLVEMDAFQKAHNVSSSDPVAVRLWELSSMIGYQMNFSGIPTDVHYEIVGDGVDETTIRSMQRNGIPFVYRDGRVRRLGNVSRNFVVSNRSIPTMVRDVTPSAFDVTIYRHEKSWRRNSSLPQRVLGNEIFQSWNESNLEYTLQYKYTPTSQLWDIRSRLLHSIANDVGQFCRYVQGVMSTRGCDRVVSLSLMNQIHDAWLRNLTRDSLALDVRVLQMPFRRSQFRLRLNLQEVVCTVVFPLLLNLLLPTFIYKLVSEKKTKVREMMFLMGMKRQNYVISNVCFMLVFYLIFCFFFVIIGAYGFRYRVLTQTHPGLLVVVFLGSAFTIISMSHFLASIIRSEILAIVVGYFFVLFVPILSMVLDYYVLKDGRWGVKPLLIFETIPISDSLFRLIEACQTLHCERSFDALWKNKDLLFAVCMMYGMAIILFVIGLYLDVVLPQQWGRRESPFCCLQGLCRKKKKSLEIEEEESSEGVDVDVAKLRRDILSGSIDEKSCAVLLRKLTKRFKSTTAVNDVCFAVKSNEIFGLLGPNGAGKTSLLRCLVGLHESTSGEAYVAGHSIDSGMSNIRDSLGFCPQFDVLWNSLTPSETLLFFTRLKGVPVFEEQAHVDAILRSTGLRKERPKACCWLECLDFLCSVRESTVSGLSGGERRRLAIAVSLCGDPDVVLLDEPTTGLDLSVKRQIWEILLEQKQHRTVLLTTHSMEEADVLSDTIAIMSRGDLVCCGPSLLLKQRYGTGYTLGVDHFGDRASVLGFIAGCDVLSRYEMKLIREFGNSMTWEIRPSEVAKRVRISEIFDVLRGFKESKGIEDFSLDQTTLQDVFLNVIAQAEAEVIKEEKKRSKIEDGEEEGEEDGEVAWTEPSNSVPGGMAINSASSFGINSYGDDPDDVIDSVHSTSMDVRPSIAINSAEHLGALLGSRKHADFVKSFESGGMLEPVGPSRNRSCCALCAGSKCCVLVCFRQFLHLVLKNACLSFRNGLCTIVLWLSPIISVFFIFLLSLIVVRKDTVMHPSTELESYRPCYQWGHEPCYSLAYYNGSTPLGDQALRGAFLDLGVSPDALLQFSSCEELTSWILANPNRTDVAVCFSDPHPFFGEPPTFAVGYDLFFNATTHDMNRADSVDQSRVWKRALDQAMMKFFGGDSSIRMNQKPFPVLEQVQDGQWAVFSSQGPNFLSITTMLLFIVLLTSLVKEKERGLKQAIMISGGTCCSYFASWMCTFVVHAFVMSLVALLAGMAFVLYPFIDGNQLILLVLFFMYNLTFISIAFCLSSLISSLNVAIVVSFIIFSATTVLNNLLANGVLIYLLDDTSSGLGGLSAIAFFLQFLYPSFNFAKAFTDILHKTVRTYDPVAERWVRGVGYSFSDLGELNSQEFNYGVTFTTPATYISFLFLIWNIAFPLILHLVIEVVVCGLPARCQMIRHFCSERRGARETPKLDPEAEESEKTSLLDAGQDGVDVEMERKSAMEMTSGYRLRLLDVHKTYVSFPRCPPCKKALHGCSFGVPDHCSMALLGHNGAGKTTAISLINGSTSLTGGDIRLGGDDSIHACGGLSRIRRHVGVCFQESVLFDNLTAAQNLRLFCRLRGVRWKESNFAVARALREVSLWGVRNDLVRTFSGGMKRRLSVACASVSSPDILLLDEPTTGMDPYSKREVWSWMYRLKKRRSLLFTTHSMEEADALGDKVAILSQGRLKCVGSPMELKSRFGAYYIVRLLAKRSGSKGAVVESREPVGAAREEEESEAPVSAGPEGEGEFVEVEVGEGVVSPVYEPEDDGEEVEEDGEGEDGDSSLRRLRRFLKSFGIENYEEEANGVFRVVFASTNYRVLSRFLTVLEDQLENPRGPIGAFGLCHTSLEDVYMRAMGTLPDNLSSGGAVFRSPIKESE